MEDRRAVSGRWAMVAAWLWLAAFWWLWLYACTDPGQTRAEAALACARASDGADGSIAACYTGRGLPVPGDL